MEIVQVPMYSFAANCYIVTDGACCAVVDPGAEGVRIVDALRQKGLAPEMILLTHGHFDHIGAAKQVKAAFPQAVVTGCRKDEELFTDPAKNLGRMYSDDPQQYQIEVERWVAEGDVIQLGQTAITVLETPGHTPGSVCYQWDKGMFSGDTLFDHSYGRVDLYGGDPVAMIASLRRLSTLAGDDRATVYPGHESICTLGESRRFLQQLLGEYT